MAPQAVVASTRAADSFDVSHIVSPTQVVRWKENRITVNKIENKKGKVGVGSRVDRGPCG